ncbi:MULTISPECIES: exodeoxyribonuclease VII small subunit [Salimicrobium]|uniref:Exodeoxyribonuclease 7 small subunit n=3 Tax=Salimicrobium TaxID=351195 RepID=K2GPI9_9BACI|nr:MULTISPECIES: exodeoxyribonuclease VII small subunit [Salimicrobium]AKG04334.1 exodeoxyribonuclease VII small subunit [Salimicrobium jeotgali]EKE32309.1 exodeoxyribonuclease VII small subunit [Salimicrobium jeotgali]MBM7695922.1 exodeoxyribonuclease VII small subunit [Salimicrobium jeotgali]SDX69733.1 Exodeoxyribonuclease VII small subunit [Salimicrobium album]SIS54025.1 Exodeoxyribonuclease VII small subunit [Salimicrobium salexigens]
MSDNKEQTFEENMKQLEEIVEKLESGDVPLEKAIQYYHEGMKLSKTCNDKLSSVEGQMKQILNEQGEFESFDIQEDE